MNIDDYKKPAWATFCRVLGVICFLIFSIIALGYLSDHRRIRFDDLVKTFMLYSGLAVGSLIHFWFVAWCVETFAGIRHYAREAAIALTSGDEEEEEEEEAEDTKPNASQEQ